MQQSRKAGWEHAARDRVRFEKRIEIVGEIIASVFEYNHRCRIYNERFLN